MGIRKLLILFCFIAGCSPNHGGNLDLDNFKNNLLDLHNKERISRNIVALNLDEKLCEYAQAHASKMAKQNNLYHSKMNDLMDFCKKNSAAENIAYGQENEKSVTSSWMQSTDHRRNILDSDYRNVGFGATRNKSGEIYWCSVFSN